MHPVMIDCTGEAFGDRWAELACRRCGANAHITDMGELKFFEGLYVFAEHIERVPPDLDFDRSNVAWICYKNDVNDDQARMATSEYRNGRYSKYGQFRCHLHLANRPRYHPSCAGDGARGRCSRIASITRPL
jgi:hypothetical protein